MNWIVNILICLLIQFHQWGKYHLDWCEMQKLEFLKENGKVAWDRRVSEYAIHTTSSILKLKK